MKPLTAIIAAATFLSAAPAFAQGLPVPGASTFESALADGPLGPAIYAALHFYSEATNGPYQWSGYIPCDVSSPGCGTPHGNGPYNQLTFAFDLSLAGCLYYQSLSLLTYFGAPPHGPVGGCEPTPLLNSESYAFDGFQVCDGGLFCFNGWLRLFLGGLNEQQCYAMMVRSGYRLPPERSGPSPPRGICIPTIPLP